MILYEVEWGSRLFGVRTLQSDRDLGLIITGETRPDRPAHDCTILRARQVLQHAGSGDPRLALWAFAPELHIRTDTDFTHELRGQRPGLLTKDLVRSCQEAGYALINSRGGRLSAKEAYLVRTYQYLQRQILQQRTIRLPPPEHEQDELRAIRSGARSPGRVARSFREGQKTLSDRSAFRALPDCLSDELIALFEEVKRH